MKLHSASLEKALDQKLVNARKANLKRLNDIEHRLEFVEIYNGIEYVNDAKASDLNSSWHSIDCMDKPLIWIMSSCAHEEDYSSISEMDFTGIRAIIVMGSAQNKVIDMLQGKLDLIGRVNTIQEAVSHATLVAQDGDVVLYSPGFSDFENYQHYKELGQGFRKAVREMRL